MTISTQSLNDHGSKFWQGRAWLRGKNYSDISRVEWYFGKHARGPALKLTLGDTDCGRALRFHICIPFIVSLFVTVPGFFTLRKPMEFGVAIHNNSIWLYTGCSPWESNSKDPWWRKTHSWEFPWSLTWHSTEVLPHRAVKKNTKPIWREDRKNRKPFMESYAKRNLLEATVTKTYPYQYQLKNGKVQYRDASVFVTRMTWRARWWPLIPITKISTTISVAFNGEVGEGTGSWKGGCLGCGYEMLPDETPCMTLGRMERERKFGR